LIITLLSATGLVVCQFIAAISITGGTTTTTPSINVPKHQHPQPWLRLVRVRIRGGDIADRPT
jgi:hypothetical protein